MDLEKVADVIVEQSLKDQVFSKEAGRICYTIVQVHPFVYMAVMASVKHLLNRVKANMLDDG